MLKELNPYVRFIDKTENVRFGRETIAYDCRFIYVLDGYCDVLFGGKHHRIKGGDAVYLPPYEAYVLRGASSAVLEIIHFDLTGQSEGKVNRSTEPSVEASSKKAEAFAPFDQALLVQDFDCRALLSELERTAFLPSPYACDRASCLLKEILLALAEQSEKEDGISPLTKKLLEYVDAHFTDAEISNQDIAAHFGYHPYHISRVMRKETGRTLKAYIIWYRLQVAANMLSLTDTSIADVAHASGFESQSYFSKMFREEFGITPGEYRKKHTQSQE